MNTIPEYITPGAFVRIRDGSKARIYATDGLIPIHGAIWVGSGWVSEKWYAGGVKNFDGDSPLDIVGPWVVKPDCSKLWPMLPPWIGWVALDNYPSASDGWCGYSEKPRRNGECEMWEGRGPLPIPPEYAPAFTGDWGDSLCERPRP